MIRVRIAPSPTGIPHIGNTRTALFNYLFAKHNKGNFILRIEDTDKARIVKGAKEAIFEILEWLGLVPDETYIQSERLDFYRDAAQKLQKQGFAREEEGAIRFIVPKGQILGWCDVVGNKKISFKSEAIEDFIILKSDGFPTYHLASVVDDHLMKISHIIRGDEWISSTPKHILLYKALNFELPVFAHLPVILGSDKSKLSKRHGAKSVLDYRDEGYLKEALLNFMALLGWNPGGNRELMSLSEMIALFDLKDVNTNSPIFDVNKLRWFNSYYIRKLSLKELKSRLCQGFGGQAKLKNIEKTTLDKLIPLAQTRMTTLNDFYDLTKAFFEKEKVVLSEKEKIIAKKLLVNFESINNWNQENIFTAMKKVLEEEKVRMAVIYKIMTGKESGLPLPQTLEILGKEETIKRIKKLKA